MTIFKISSRKEQALLQRMKELNICEDRNQKRKRAKRAKKKESASKTKQSDAKENNDSPENVTDIDS
jgi:hypothetical protein